MILKKLRDKKSHLWTKNWRYKGPVSTNQISIYFSEALMIPLKSERVSPNNIILTFGFKNFNVSF